MKTAVQLYTFHEQEFDNLKGVCALLKKIGYDGVEVCNHIGKHSARELRDTVRGEGLEIFSVHAAYATLTRENIAETMNYYQEAGIRNIVLPIFKPEDFGTYGNMVNELNRMQRELSGNGFNFLYHNHSLEFENRDENGKTQMEYILRDTDVALQVDVFWIRRIGIDPVEFARKNKDRVKMLHLKDWSANTEKPYAVVGDGVIDWDAVFGIAAENKIGTYIVEIDQIYGETEDWLKRSLDFIKKFRKI